MCTLTVFLLWTTDLSNLKVNQNEQFAILCEILPLSYYRKLSWPDFIATCIRLVGLMSNSVRQRKNCQKYDVHTVTHICRGVYTLICITTQRRKEDKFHDLPDQVNYTQQAFSTLIQHWINVEISTVVEKALKNVRIFWRSSKKRWNFNSHWKFWHWFDSTLIFQHVFIWRGKMSLKIRHRNLPAG